MKSFIQNPKTKYFAWLLVLFNIIFILALTLQDATATMQLSTGTRDAVVEIINTPVEVAKQSWWYRNIRKLGHIPEYLTLGITVSFAWYLTTRRAVYLKSFVLCAMISFGDQLLKGLLPTREFDVTDFPFDFVGYALGICLMMVFCKRICGKILTQQ